MRSSTPTADKPNIVRELPVQNLPFEPRLSEDEKTLIVTNWGDRPPKDGERKAKSQFLWLLTDERGAKIRAVELDPGGRSGAGQREDRRCEIKSRGNGRLIGRANHASGHAAGTPRDHRAANPALVKLTLAAAQLARRAQSLLVTVVAAHEDQRVVAQRRLIAHEREGAAELTIKIFEHAAVLGLW